MFLRFDRCSKEVVKPECADAEGVYRRLSTGRDVEQAREVSVLCQSTNGRVTNREWSCRWRSERKVLIVEGVDSKRRWRWKP
jgi:hypothetical protein